MKLPLAIHCAIKLLNEGKWIVFESKFDKNGKGDLVSIIPGGLGGMVQFMYETPERRNEMFSVEFLEENADLVEINGVKTLRIGDFTCLPSVHPIR
jgi:hypothetical protein